jgi:diguanylate cyclase (GGDEF)-like protein
MFSLLNKLKNGSLDITLSPNNYLSTPASSESTRSTLNSPAPKRSYRRNVLLWFLLMAVLLGSEGFLAYRNISAYINDAEWVDHTHHVLIVLGDTFSAIKDVESATRGYVLTGKSELLEPTSAVRERVTANLQTLRQLTSDNPQRLQDIPALEQKVKEKLNFSQLVIASRQREGFEAATKFLSTGQGAQMMDEIRALITAIESDEQSLLQQRNLAAHNSARATVFVALLGIGLSFSILVIVYFMIRREHIRRIALEDGLEQTNARLQSGLAEMEQLTREMNLQQTMGELLQSCLTFQEAGEVINKTVPRLLPGTAGALCLINPSKNLVETVMTWGEAPPHESAFFSPDECWALRRGRLHYVRNRAKDLLCAHVACSIPHGYMCVPLIAHGETLGVLHLCAMQEAALGDSKQHIIRTVAEQFSLTLANLRLQQTLRTQSINDPLTGLFNRRYMEASLEREILRAKRHETALSVIMLDVDHFKSFNDTFGHGAGDVLLQEVSQALRSCARGEDIVCRYGGEEFIIILPGASSAVARQRAKRIGETVKKIQVAYHGQTLASVTVSLGVAAYPEHSETHDDLIRMADAALYSAKHAGRDCVVVSDCESFVNYDVQSQTVA